MKKKSSTEPKAFLDQFSTLKTMEASVLDVEKFYHVFRWIEGGVTLFVPNFTPVPNC
jgi:hypothetical protein